MKWWTKNVGNGWKELKEDAQSKKNQIKVLFLCVSLLHHNNQESTQFHLWEFLILTKNEKKKMNYIWNAYAVYATENSITCDTLTSEMMEEIKKKCENKLCKRDQTKKIR